MHCESWNIIFLISFVWENNQKKKEKNKNKTKPEPVFERGGFITNKEFLLNNVDKNWENPLPLRHHDNGFFFKI